MTALPAELTIYTVAEWQPRLLAWLVDEGTLELDAAGVTEADTAGVQLLVALARSAEQQGRRLVLARPAEALASACSKLGADFLLLQAPAVAKARP